MEMKSLQPEDIPLTGRHLIEASAGTGKTYNITRLYLRLLLERKLEVQEILVMTFTRAATEELRGRIARELRNALENWRELAEQQPFFETLNQRVDFETAKPLLRRALLHLDEASILTIHGFCKRVLSQQAFLSGLSFRLSMEADTREVELEAVEDWYRKLAPDRDAYRLIANQWPTPTSFLNSFRRAITSEKTISVRSQEALETEYFVKKQRCLEQLLVDQAEVFTLLVDSHKDRKKRIAEWEVLLEWLGQEDYSPIPKTASAFFGAGRFGRDPEKKAHLHRLLDGIRELHEEAKEIEKRILRVAAYEMVCKGITAIRGALSETKLRKGLLNFDDLVASLATALSRDHGELRDALRTLYPVALVDEFQDTDPLQYQILDSIYPARSDTALFMIGDPKQAIYGFRGGDVFAYLQARSETDHQWLMETNWRSAPKMVEAYNRLFMGASTEQNRQDLFNFGIQYTPVKAGLGTEETRLVDPKGDEALCLVDFPVDEVYQTVRGSQVIVNQSFCEVMANWCAAEIQRLLEQPVQIAERSIEESDIAILVRDRREAEYIQIALQQIGYTSVYLSTRDNLFHSQEAWELYQVLLGVLNLENERLMFSALSTRYFSGNTERLFQAKEDEVFWEERRERFVQLRTLWLERGFIAMALSILYQDCTPDPDHHERALTNAIHLFELLQQASQQYQQPRQLLDWFEAQINAEGARSEAELRLESDANLIRIITQHGSKGLEYPVVFVPFATRYRNPVKVGSRTIELVEYHDRETFKAHYHLEPDAAKLALNKEEGHAESVRLLYVAITRAQYRCYIGSAVFADYSHSPLGQLLQLEEGEDLSAKLKALANELPHAIAYQIAEDSRIAGQEPQKPSEAITGEVAHFQGKIERNWWLSSFSSLTRNLRHGGLSTPDHDQMTLGEEKDTNEPDPELRFVLRKGADAGNLLHDTLERVDFANPGWNEHLEKPLARFGVLPDSFTIPDLIEWLVECLDTKLPSGNRLSDLAWSDTLRESEFYFPIQHVRFSGLIQMLAKHRQRVVPLQLPDHQALQGMMHGFIDLIFHWQGKYYVVDYKSTHLGDQLEDYGHESLEINIQENYYDLQYLIYSLALHRYLSTRLETYNPEEHFGGVFYLYLRGMHPSHSTGIYQRAISSTELNQLDQLFGEVCHDF